MNSCVLDPNFTLWNVYLPRAGASRPLTGSRSPGEKLRFSPMNEAFAAFEEKVNKIRDQEVSNWRFYQ
jgi:hypothetical protein